ncbi:MAG: hypothetical protein ACM3YE_01945 [Bacteroidota bacterium]
MKKLILILTLSLLLIPNNAFAAVHNSMKADFSSPSSLTMPDAPLDTWFSIAKDEPFIKGIYRSSDGIRKTDLVGFEYYKNDHCFFNVSNISEEAFGSKVETTSIKGSYLFESGFFIGGNHLSYKEEDGSESWLYLSPGFKVELGNDSYYAFSFDYISTVFVDEIIGYEFDLKYFTDNMKFIGQLYSPKYGDTSFGVGFFGNISHRNTAGIVYNSSEDYSLINAGLTSIFDNLIIDFMLVNEDDEDEKSTIYALSGMYKIGDIIKMGLQYEKDKDVNDPAISVKANINGLQIRYLLENDSYGENIYAAYEYQF